MTDTGSPKVEAHVADVAHEDAPAAAAVEEVASPAKESVEAAAAEAPTAAATTSNGTPAGDAEDEAPKAAGKSKSRKNKKGKAAAAAAEDADADESAAAASPSKSADLAKPASTDADAAASSQPAAESSSKSASPAAAVAPATPGTAGPASRTSSGAAAAAVPERTSSAGGKPPASPAVPSPAAAAATAADRKSSAGGSGSLEDMPDGSAPKVKALRQQLSQNGSGVLTGGIAQPPPPEPKPEAGPSRRLSEHDRVNNTNALELLQSGAFKLVPGKDTVPYEKLMGLRLEDGIDVTRKEEYLSADEFSTVFKMDKGAFEKLPQWKRLQLKKSTLLF